MAFTAESPGTGPVSVKVASETLTLARTLLDSLSFSEFAVPLQNNAAKCGRQPDSQGHTVPLPEPCSCCCDATSDGSMGDCCDDLYGGSDRHRRASSDDQDSDQATTAELKRAREAIGSRRHFPPEVPGDVAFDPSQLLELIEAVPYRERG